MMLHNFVQPRDVGLPVNAYVAREQVKPEGTEKAQQVFVHLPTAVSQTEAEEIGVEHLLRDVKDATVSTLSTDIVSQAQVQLPVLFCTWSRLARCITIPGCLFFGQSVLWPCACRAVWTHS